MLPDSNYTPIFLRELLTTILSLPSGLWIYRPQMACPHCIAIHSPNQQFLIESSTIDSMIDDCKRILLFSQEEITHYCKDFTPCNRVQNFY